LVLCVIWTWWHSLTYPLSASDYWSLQDIWRQTSPASAWSLQVQHNGYYLYETPESYSTTMLCWPTGHQCEAMQSFLQNYCINILTSPMGYTSNDEIINIDFKRLIMGCVLCKSGSNQATKQMGSCHLPSALSREEVIVPLITDSTS
jgi:hypothetical protein